MRILQRAPRGSQNLPKTLLFPRGPPEHLCAPPGRSRGPKIYIKQKKNNKGKEQIANAKKQANIVKKNKNQSKQEKKKQEIHR
jgi:hypothetical protein